MERLVPLGWQQMAAQMSDWLTNAVFVPSTLEQAVSVLFLGGAVWLTARPLQERLVVFAGWVPSSPLSPVALALARAGPWIVLLLLIWFVHLAFNGAGSRADLLRLAESLILLWVLIRLSSRLVRNEAAARAIAVAAWVIAALHTAGLIGPALSLMDSMAVPVGNFRLSLLLLLKGAVTLTILVWLATTIARLVENQLDRLSGITPAMRILAAKITRLVLMVCAAALALGSIGINLTAFAVFSGAVGVGVGFGLQKVVSNLVSGVILLLDRSIKPGDVIEIDSTHGVVSALNARYTAITTREGKEYLVPNEDLIARHVTNWSYSNELIRLHVRVGISYQMDPHNAIALAARAALDTPRVLPDPAPTCLLVEFGDSSIVLELRFWIRDPVNGTTNVRSAVMLHLWDLYQANGIEIPYPHRNITLHTQEPLSAVLRDRRATAEQ